MKFAGKKLISLVLVAILVVSTLIVGTVSAGATTNWTVGGTGGYLYFDNSKTSSVWSTTSRIRLFVVTADTVYAYKLTEVSGTDLLCVKSSTVFNDKVVDFISFAYITTAANKSSTGELRLTISSFDRNLAYNNDDSMKDSPSYITEGQYSSNYYGGVPSGTDSFFAFELSSSTEGGLHPTINMENIGTSYSDMNKLQSLDVTSGGSVSCSAKYLTDYKTTADAPSPINANSSSSFNATYDTTVTLTATPDTANSYMFAGWYNTSTDALVSTDTSYSYTVTGTNSLTAKFALGVIQTVGVGVDGGGTATVSGGGNSSDDNIAVASGSSVTYTALPAANKKFDGWYTTSACTGDPVSTSDPYTFTATSANTLYAKFSTVTISSEPVSLGASKNDGRRNVNSTTLSSQAINYYTSVAKNYITSSNTSSNDVYATFEALSTKESNDESSSYTVAQNNSLYTTLYTIMKETHTNSVSYPAYGNSSLAHYWLNTDTSSANYGNGDNREVYTFFYSDVDCFEHINMQREHIWPKSKASYLMKTGLGGSDLHHLRPAYGKVNNIKSNWGFADIRNSNGTIKSGWTKVRTVDVPRSGQSAKTSLWRAVDENGETFCDYNDDVHGDIARILLYIYTRWKQPNLYTDIVDSDGNPDTNRLPELDPDDTKDTGERIIYDLPTLLQWMEEDPVSEWEMKRNDLTQSVQGNRNVFIDYPELAWLIFDQEVPADYVTPSRMANGTGTDIAKGESDSRVYTDEITMDFSTVGSKNGKAEIKAFNNTTQSFVKNGQSVNRGDIITYTVIPDQSTLNTVTEYHSDSTASGNANRLDIASNLNTTSAYSFSRAAGYFNGSPNTSYEKERITVTLVSNVCELSYKVNSRTAAPKYGTGGSGSGMVTAKITGTNTILENGDTVPNGTSVTLTFTPDYGSKVYGVTRYRATTVDQLTAENNYSFTNAEGGYTFSKIAGTDSYTCTKVLDCSDGTSARVPTFTVYFAQTYNSNDKNEQGVDRHIFNKGLRPDPSDPWGEETDFTENFEICGVQKKIDEKDASNHALRFVSVVDKKILAKAQSYGWVFGYTNQNFDTKKINRLAYTLVKGGANAKTVDCTGTSNDFFGEYGKSATNTNYKYITCSVNNIQETSSVNLDTKIIARPYVELKSEYVGTGAPAVIYGQYVNFETGEEFCACSGSWNYINSLASSS